MLSTSVRSDVLPAIITSSSHGQLLITRVNLLQALVLSTITTQNASSNPISPSIEGFRQSIFAIHPIKRLCGSTPQADI
ncbi:hypothetical protein M513_11012 [Trichuris suis]|uniref:Uncharacterized protein n=1 Tax=Trichuris suis TaxID=68888 RepID=A0A085LSX3_9BILA|nr:hypothetical protein M513_11012 [Trichuris suis]